MTSSSTNTYKFEFEKDDDLEMFITYNYSSKYDYVSEIICSDYLASNYSGSDTDLGKWEFDDHKKELEITLDGERLTFEIIKLSNSLMKLEGIIDGEMQEIELEKD